MDKGRNLRPLSLFARAAASLSRRPRGLTLVSKVLAVHLVERGVTRTGNRFERGAIQHVDDSATVLDEAPPLNSSRRFGDARAADTQHLRKECVGKREGIGAGAIVRHQQPARETCLQLVKSPASGG